MTSNGKDTTNRDFGLLDRAASSEGVTIRDDQYEFPWLLDAVRVCKNKGGRFRLVDSGKRDVVSLFWLAEAGADLYSSDVARPDPKEIVPVRLSGRDAGAYTFYYIGGETTESPERAAFLSDIAELGRTGIDLHLSNRDKPREAGLLLELTRACLAGGGRLVYYHHGLAASFLEDLAGAGGWIHCAVESFDPGKDLYILRDVLSASRRSRSGFVLHLNEVSCLSLAGEAFERGAYLRFHTPPCERTSVLRKLEAEAARRRLDPRSFYLSCDFLP
jgi:hypothetical protein